MTCQYCRATIDNDAHRCSRCGRRTMDRIPVQMTAAVPNLETVEMPVPYSGGARQCSWSPRLHRSARTAVRPGLSSESVRTTVEPHNLQPLPLRLANPPKRPVTAGMIRTQQSLNFQEDRREESGRSIGLLRQSGRAGSSSRDGSRDRYGISVSWPSAYFLRRSRLAGAEFVFTKATIPYYVAAAVLISLFYRVLFCIANFDTPGVCWTGLKLVDLRWPRRRAGHRWYPSARRLRRRHRRRYRLVWAVVDEDQAYLARPHVQDVPDTALL